MGREIEAKIHLNDEEFLKVLNWFFESEDDFKIRAKEKQILFKSDEYFSQYENRIEREKNEPRVIRLRTESEIPFDEHWKKHWKRKFSSIDEVSDFLSELKSFGKTNEDKTNETKTSENLKSFFTIKTKRFENKNEINVEDETFIENPDVLRKFFNETKFRRWFYKEKKSFSCFVEENAICFHIELEIVNGLKYIEIECTDDRISENDALNGLNGIFTIFGLDESKKDIRSWVEIIEEMS